MNAICTTCGVQYAESPNLPDYCRICADERQYVGIDGQKWTTLDELRREYKTSSHAEEQGLTSFWMEPRFAIGQRAFLIETPSGNVLWDCISLLDEPAIEYVRRRGGIDAICISHPHYYTAMVEWSREFGNAPVYLHRDDAEWVMRPAPCIQFWDGEVKNIAGGLRLIRCGGHFAGATVLHWPEASGHKGALLSGDTIQVVPDRRFVSFMWSYPNYVPLPARAVQRIIDAVEPYEFDRIYGAFPKMTVAQNGKNAVRRSAERYLRAIRDGLDTQR
ncbi:MAG TPA: hypothetical protein VN737_15665 [Bryobacteraceae bacterium]|nr:hypothetical protein [Bryobacteraceae bacterium]